MSFTSKVIGLTATLIFCHHAIAAEYTFIALPTPGESPSNAYSINRAGQIVGYNPQTGVAYAATWNDGVYSPLPSLGGVFGGAVDVNNFGQAVGQSNTSLDPNTAHASSWKNGSITDLGTLGGSSSAAMAVNDSGVIAGFSQIANDLDVRATLWENGTVVELGSLTSAAFGINNSGEVVGNSGSISRATLWSGKTSLDLGSIGGEGRASGAYGINDNSQIVGWSENLSGSNVSATLWENGVITALGTLGGYRSTALDINNSGLIVGWSALSGNNEIHAVLWRDGVITDLNSLVNLSNTGWLLTEARGVNEFGWIVGNAYNTRTNDYHGFLLSLDNVPSRVPAPPAFILMLTGLGILSLTKRLGSVSKRA